MEELELSELQNSPTPQPQLGNQAARGRGLQEAESSMQENADEQSTQTTTTTLRPELPQKTVLPAPPSLPQLSFHKARRARLRA